jgi:hypothetical protein
VNIDTLLNEGSLALSGIEGGHEIMHIVLPRLRSFLAYLESVDALPERLENVSIEAFPRFVTELEGRETPDDDLHLVLACVRMTLTLSGVQAKSLIGLTAPRKRERTKDKGGKSQFVLKKIPLKTDPVLGEPELANLSENVTRLQNSCEGEKEKTNRLPARNGNCRGSNG